MNPEWIEDTLECSSKCEQRFKCWRYANGIPENKMSNIKGASDAANKS